MSGILNIDEGSANDRITQDEKIYMQDQLAKETADAQAELGQYKTTIMVERRDANFVFLKDKVSQMENALAANGNTEALAAMQKYNDTFPGKNEYTVLGGVARVRSYQIALYQALLFAKADPKDQAKLLGDTGPCGCGVDGIYGLQTLLTSAQVLKSQDTAFHGVLNDQTFSYLLDGTTVAPPPPSVGSEEAGLDNVSDIPEDVMNAMGNFSADKIITKGAPIDAGSSSWKIFDENGGNTTLDKKDANFITTMQDWKVNLLTLMQHNSTWYIWNSGESNDNTGYYPVQMDADSKIMLNDAGEPLLLGNSEPETITVTPASETIAVTGLPNVSITKSSDGTFMYNEVPVEFDGDNKTTLQIGSEEKVIQKTEINGVVSFAIIAAQAAQEEAEKQRLAQEEAEKQRLAQEEAEKQRLAQEEAEKQRIAQEEAEKQRLAQEEAEKQRIAQEEAEKQRIAQEEAEKQRLAQEEAEKQRIAQEEADKQRLLQEAAEQQRLAQEEADKQRLLQEAAEQQRLAEIEQKHTDREQLITESGIDGNQVTYDRTTENYVLPTIKSTLDASHIQDAADLKESVASEAKKYMDDIVPAIEGHFSALESVTEQRSALISSWNQSMNIKEFDDGFTNLPQAVSLQDDIVALQVGKKLIDDFSAYDKLLQDCQRVEGVNSASLQKIGEIQQSIETQATQIANSAGIQYTYSQFTIGGTTVPRGDVLKDGYTFTNDTGTEYVVSRLDTPNRGTYEVNEKPKELGVPEGWKSLGAIGTMNVLQSNEVGLSAKEHYVQEGLKRFLVGEYVMNNGTVFKYESGAYVELGADDVKRWNGSVPSSFNEVNANKNKTLLTLTNPLFSVLGDYATIPANEVVTGTFPTINAGFLQKAIAQRTLAVMSYYVTTGTVSVEKKTAITGYFNDYTSFFASDHPIVGAFNNLTTK